MTFTIAYADLRALLDTARTVAPSKGPMPILACVRLSWTHTALTATATDLIVTYRGSRPCVATEPGSVCVPAAFLASVVAAMPHGDLTVTVDPKTFRVSVKGKGARSASAIGGTSAEDFPATPDVTGDRLTIPRAMMRDLFGFVAHAMSTDDTRAHLCATFVDIDGKRIRTVSTDTRRLALCDREFTTKRATKTLFPRTFLDRLKPHLDGDGDVVLTVGARHDPVSIELPDGSLWTSKTIDADYPSCQQVIPDDADFAASALCSRQSLADAARACSIETDVLRVTLKDASMEMHSHDHTGKAADVSDAVDAAITVAKKRKLFDVIGVVASNITQACAALASVAGDVADVEIRFTGDSDPVVLSVPGDTRQLALMMPYRLG